MEGKRELARGLHGRGREASHERAVDAGDAGPRFPWVHRSLSEGQGRGDARGYAGRAGWI